MVGIIYMNRLMMKVITKLLGYANPDHLKLEQYILVEKGYTDEQDSNKLLFSGARKISPHQAFTKLITQNICSCKLTS